MVFVASAGFNPTIARGLALSALIAVVWALGGKELIRNENARPHENVCNAPIEYQKNAKSFLGCAAEIATRWPLCPQLQAGDKIHVPTCTLEPQGMSAAMRLLVDLPLPINRVSAEDLEAISGFGPSLSAAVVKVREEMGGFADLEDLQRVKGIGPKRMKLVRARFRVIFPPQKTVLPD